MKNKMTHNQRKRADKLIVDECCNYDKGNCLLIRSGAGRCPQLGNHEIKCTIIDKSINVHKSYFIEAVLPIDETLLAELVNIDISTKCKKCGSTFQPSSNRQEYCKNCSKRERKIKEATRQRESRAKRTHLDKQNAC